MKKEKGPQRQNGQGSLKVIMLLLLLLLSHFSRVRLYATLETAAHQALPSLEFSRQEHWSGLPFPSPMRESEVAQSFPTLGDPMDCSLPGSSAHGIFQARVLEWGATGSSGDLITSMYRGYLEKHWINFSGPIFFLRLYLWKSQWRSVGKYTHFNCTQSLLRKYFM